MDFYYLNLFENGEAMAPRANRSCSWVDATVDKHDQRMRVAYTLKTIYVVIV